MGRWWQARYPGYAKGSLDGKGLRVKIAKCPA
jgi:hypothetical protein